MSMATVRTADSFDHWWDAEGRKRIVLFRRSLRTSTTRYVERVPSIPGVPPDLNKSFPEISMLAEAYVNLVRGELAHHNADPDAALWTGLLFGPLFSQIWATASAVRIEGMKVPDEVRAFRGANTEAQAADATWISQFAASLPRYDIQDWIALETLETAVVLSKGYLKAFAEFAVASKQSDVIVTRHHSALLAEIIGDMLNLVLMGGERTDERLPDSHIHKQLALQQEKLRCTNAPKIWC